MMRLLSIYIAPPINSCILCSSIISTRCMKEGRNFRTVRLQRPQMRTNIFSNSFGTRRSLLTDSTLEITVDKFIRIILRSVRRQREKLDPILRNVHSHQSANSDHSSKNELLFMKYIQE